MHISCQQCWQSATEVSGPAAAPQGLVFSSVFVREAVCCRDSAVKPAEERAYLANASTPRMFLVKDVRVGTLSGFLEAETKVEAMD